jgi:hypothetical protein
MSAISNNQHCNSKSNWTSKELEYLEVLKAYVGGKAKEAKANTIIGAKQ